MFYPLLHLMYNIPTEVRKASIGSYPLYQAYRERNAFIMAQAPLESTIEDFWQMGLQYKIGTVVMLNNLQEDNAVRLRIIVYLSSPLLSSPLLSSPLPSPPPPLSLSLSHSRKEK